MFQYRAVLVRMRQGDSDRDIARARLMGRRKVAAFRALATRHGWLDAHAPLPEDAQIAAVVGRARRARSTISTVEPFRDIVARWVEQGVAGVAIHPNDAARQRVAVDAGRRGHLYRRCQKSGEPRKSYYGEVGTCLYVGNGGGRICDETGPGIRRQ